MPTYSEHNRSLRESIASVLSDMPVFWEMMARALVAHYGPRIDEDMMNVRLAFHEAIANVIKHAHQEDGRPLWFELNLKTDQIELRIWDTGPGFTWPEQDHDVEFDFEDESGRGLFLMRTLMDDAQYLREGDKNLTLLRKTIKDNAAGNTRLPSVTPRSVAPRSVYPRSTYPQSTLPQARSRSIVPTGMDTLRRRRVLVADDDEMTRHMLARLIGKMGHEVILARDGQEAIDRFDKCPKLDAVLIDVMMPNVDGLEAVRRIREGETESYTPIVLLTSKDKAEDIAAGFDAGADEYIVKPPRQAELSARLRAAFRLIDMACELREQSMQLQTQLQEARDLQCAMLPPESYTIGPFNCASIFRPSHYVGGDMLNTFKVDDTRCGLYLADVSGHGVPAALLSMWINRTLQPLRGPGAIIAATCEEAPGYRIFSPAEICDSLDSLLATSECDKYLTIAYVEGDLQSGNLRYCNAGHPPPLVQRRNKRWDRLEQGGAPVGMGLGLGFDNGSGSEGSPGGMPRSG